MYLTRTERSDALLIKALEAYANGYYRRAFRLFKRLAKTGNAEAARQVASMYRSGEGVKANSQRATEWYERAVGLDQPKIQSPFKSFDHERPAAQKTDSAPRSRDQRNFPMAFAGLFAGAALIASILGLMSIKVTNPTAQFGQIVQHLEARVLPRMENLINTTNAGTRDSLSENTIASGPRPDADSAATEPFPKPLAGQDTVVEPAYEASVGQGSLPDPPPWDKEVPGNPRFTEADSEAPVMNGAPRPPDARPTIVLAARAHILVRVLDANNNALVDRRFEPGDTFTVPSREGLLVTSDTPQQLDIIVDGKTVNLPADLRPWDRVKLDATKSSAMNYSPN